MRHVDPGADWASWRQAARGLLAAAVPPEEVVWTRESEALLDIASVSSDPQEEASVHGRKAFHVPAAFVDLAQAVICHADERRWALLYRMLWRLTRGGERHLLELASDHDVLIARRMEKAVRREEHKMHAFVRFRKAGENETGREYFVACFEPEHWIVELASPFFRDRFANMDWSIFTPRGCAHWVEERLHFTLGVARDPLATEDDLERLWKTYYASIFNPARLKLKAMQSEMPKKFWKNLPETKLISRLTRHSAERVATMLESPARPPRPQPRQAYLESLKSLPGTGEEVAPE